MALSHSSNLLKLGLFPEAEAFCTRLLKRYPGALEHNRAIARLFLGKLGPAWRDFEHRPTGVLRAPVPAPFTPWDGRPTPRLYVEMEQGLGDNIQFLRYLPALRPLAAEIVVIVRRSLVRLVRRVVPSARIVAKDEEFEAARGHYVRSMSLPLWLRQPVPSASPYIVPAESDVRSWRDRLGLGRRRAVGVAWSTGSGNATSKLRRLDAAALRPLVRAGIDLVPLQPIAAEELDEVLALGLEPLPDNDLYDVASILPSLAGVVTIDTVFAHLGGAVGVPTIVSHGPHLDWRWPEAAPHGWYRTVSHHRAGSLAAYRSGFAVIARDLEEALFGAALV